MVADADIILPTALNLQPRNCHGLRIMVAVRIAPETCTAASVSTAGSGHEYIRNPDPSSNPGRRGLVMR